MRADRLVSLVLLLRQRGRLTAPAIAAELEVSTRTVLRDIEALSSAGVPVYAERGRHGGFALLPGFRTELAGLTADETLALLVAGSFGLGTAHTGALLKVLDAVPSGQRAVAHTAAQRFLVEPEVDLLERRLAADAVDPAVLVTVRRATFTGLRLRLRYARPTEDPTWRTVDPVGLVVARGQAYLLATRSGQERTYRLSRVLAAEALDEPASRPDDVDLAALWRERSARFRAGPDQVDAVLRLRRTLLPELERTALATGPATEVSDNASGDWVTVSATFQDARHAVWFLWQLADDAEALEPATLRDAIRARAESVAARHTDT